MVGMVLAFSNSDGALSWPLNSEGARHAIKGPDHNSANYQQILSVKMHIYFVKLYHQWLRWLCQRRLLIG